MRGLTSCKEWQFLNIFTIGVVWESKEPFDLLLNICEVYYKIRTMLLGAFVFLMTTILY